MTNAIRIAITIVNTVAIAVTAVLIGLIIRTDTVVVARRSISVATVDPVILTIRRVAVISAPWFIGVSASVATASRLVVFAFAFALFLVLGAVRVVVGTAGITLGLALLRAVGLSVAIIIVGDLLLHIIGEELLRVG